MFGLVGTLIIRTSLYSGSSCVSCVLGALVAYAPFVVVHAFNAACFPELGVRTSCDIFGPSDTFRTIPLVRRVRRIHRAGIVW